MAHLTYITEEQVKGILHWPEVFTAVDEAFRAVVPNVPEDVNSPNSSNPARSFTFGPNRSGILLTMPGFIGNYHLPTQEKPINTLGCKLVTSFEGNPAREPPLPTIMATILLMSPETGKLEAIVEGTEITKWRTAAASLVATKYLFFDRPSGQKTGLILSIIGCGVQGEINAIAFASYFDGIAEIRLFNRTTSRRDSLFAKLQSMRGGFKNPNVLITKSNTSAECVHNADIIVTATNSDVAMVVRSDLKENVHINGKEQFAVGKSRNFQNLLLPAIGAGRNHHSELAEDIYNACQLYPDNYESSRTELSKIFDKITGIVGEVILGLKPQPVTGITVFQSMGMAVEDAAVAQLMLEKNKQGVA